MEWTKVLFCFFLATSCTVNVKTEHSEEERTKQENINSSKNTKLQPNTTKRADESLEESPSETIRFKKTFNLKQRETNSNNNSRTETRARSENIKEPQSGKDLKNEENRYVPVMTFTETSKPYPDRRWIIIPPEASPYRGENVFRNPTPVPESQSFVNKPKVSSMHNNYPPPGNFEGRHIDEPRSSEYSESFDNRSPRYPDSENPPSHGHGIHTETTHDYGRFLNVDYKTQIERDAEEMIKRKNGQNSTRGGRPTRPNEENPQNAPRQYHQYQQPGHKAFYHLGNFHTPNTYQSPDIYHNTDGERHQYTSQEHPNTENYPTQQHTYAPRKPESQTDYYIPKKPVSSSESYGSQFPHSRKQHNSFYSRPPNAPRQYDHSTEQYPPTHLQREPPLHVRTTPQSPTQYITPTEQLSPHYHAEEKKYPTSSKSGFTQPPKHISPQYHSGEKNLPISYYSDNLQPPDPTSSQYHSGEKNVPISYNSGHTQTPEHVSLQYHSGEKNFPISYTTGYGQYEDSTIPPKKDFQKPYSETPREPTLPIIDADHLRKQPVSYSHAPYGKSEEEIYQERSYYRAYKSLIDLYKQYGFQPLDIDEIPEFYPPRYAFGNPFGEKIPISAPISGAISTNQYTPNHKVQEYAKNVDTSAPGQHNYGAPYEETWHNNNGAIAQEKSPYKPDSNENPMPMRLQNTYYHEQIPYDSNRSPVVSTEYYDTSDISKPGVFNTQVESPKETFYQGEFPTKSSSPLRPTEDDSRSVERKPIRIKDYNSETFFENPSQKNEANSAERGLSSPPTNLAPHSIIRKNPPYLTNSNSEEEINIEYNERPRKYPQNIPSDVSAENGMSNFRPPHVDGTSKGNAPTDSSYDDDSYHGEYNPPKVGQSSSPKYESHQWMSKPDNSPKVPWDTQKDVISDVQQHRSNKRKRPRQSSEKMVLDEEPEYEQKKQKSARNTNSHSRTKKHEKRSSQKRIKKHKPSRRSQNRDHLRAEGSTYHWGMERHKDTDGFFQYANVPGAKAFEFGYRMGGPDQMREKHHRTLGIQSKIKVNWEDKNGDKGDHYWEFNHDSKEDDTEVKEPKPDTSYE